MKPDYLPFCCDCGDKNPEHFTTQRRGRYWQPRCRDCQSVYHRGWRERNAERIKVYNRNYRRQRRAAGLESM